MTILLSPIPISALPPAGPIAGNELVPIVQNGQTLKATMDDIAQPSAGYLLAAGNSHLHNSRVLTQGANIQFVDAGPEGTFTISSAHALLDNAPSQTIDFNATGNGNGLAVVNESVDSITTTEVAVANLSHALHTKITSSGYSISLLTNGPTGEQAALYTTGAIPLSIGTNSTAQILISGTGNIDLLASGSGKISITGGSVGTTTAPITRPNININGGAVTTSGAAGNVNITGGMATAGLGGGVALLGGFGTTGGIATLTGGPSNSGAGGAVTISGGSGTTAGGALSISSGSANSGAAGAINVQAGISTEANGASINITAGNANTAGATAHDGGSITITTGSATGAGAAGSIILATTANIKFGNTATGASTGTLSTANKPGADAGVIAWIPVLTAGGTQGYVPVIGA